MARGRRESEWLVIRRCLALIRRVERGPATREELLEALLAAEQVGANTLSREQRRTLAAQPDPALLKRLEQDLARVRESLLVDVHFDRKQGRYDIDGTWLGLLDLPDEDLATVAWLEETFEMDSPQHDEVHALTGRLRRFLSPARRGDLEQQRSLLTLDVRQRDDDAIPPEVWEGLSRAVSRRQRIAFDYVSPQYGDGLARRHVVEPYEAPHFDAARGHFYLRGWCLAMVGPGGREEVRRNIPYRLGRMSRLEVLPDKLPPGRPHSPTFAVVYRLNPEVARLGVSRHPHIVIEAVERQEDGGAVVRGVTEDAFWAQLELMHYRENCQVLGGPELLASMRETVRRMGEVYGVGDDVPVVVGGGV